MPIAPAAFPVSFIEDSIMSTMIQMIVRAAKDAGFVARFTAGVEAADRYRGQKNLAAKDRAAKAAVKAEIMAAFGMSQATAPQREAGLATTKGLVMLTSGHPVGVLVANLDNPAAQIPLYWALDAVRQAMAYDAYRCSTANATRVERKAAKDELAAALGKAYAFSDSFQPTTEEPYGSGYEATVYADVKSPRAQFEADSVALLALATLYEPSNTVTPALCRLYPAGVATQCDEWADIEAALGGEARIREDKAVNLRESWDSELEDDQDDDY